MELLQKTRIFSLKAISICFELIFCMILFCVIVFGNDMDYNASFHPTLIRPEWEINLVAFVGIGVSAFIGTLEKKELTPTQNKFVNISIVGIFILLFYINCRLVREIAFQLPWDISVVQGAARNYADGNAMGYVDYFSMYINNIPITYFIGKIFRFAMKNTNVDYISDYLFMIINSFFFALTALFSFLIVKNITRKIFPSLLVLGMNIALIVSSAWKMAPYTDAFGIAFPIEAVFFYVHSQTVKRQKYRFLFVVVAILFSMIGGLIKPNIYIITIAIVGMELLELLHQFKKKIVSFLLEIACLLMFLGCSHIYLNHMIQELQLDYNPEVTYDWHHYFMMGQNEETTGSYYSGDVSIIGQYQFDSEARKNAEMEIAFERIKDKGVVGTLLFGMKKLTMTFNDGTFGWSYEVWTHGRYTNKLSSESNITLFLREIYWKGKYAGAYYLLCQICWIFVLFSIPFSLYKKSDDPRVCFMAVCFLGIILYQLLFEARARYLFVFLPLITCMAAIGLNQLSHRLANRKTLTRVNMENGR